MQIINLIYIYLFLLELSSHEKARVLSIHSKRAASTAGAFSVCVCALSQSPAAQTVSQRLIKTNQ